MIMTLSLFTIVMFMVMFGHGHGHGQWSWLSKIDYSSVPDYFDMPHVYNATWSMSRCYGHDHDHDHELKNWLHCIIDMWHIKMIRNR